VDDLNRTTGRARRALATIAFCFAATAAACRGPAPRAEAWRGETKARCPVCVAEGDLACVDVRVDGSTPKASVDGQTYCFCSEECRCAFLRHPTEYVQSAPR
jgi:YHS domain-containing protein